MSLNPITNINGSDNDTRSTLNRAGNAIYQGVINTDIGHPFTRDYIAENTIVLENAFGNYTRGYFNLKFVK